MYTNGIIGVMTDELFLAEKRRLNGVIFRLNKANKLLQKAQVDGFVYDGDYYLPKTGTRTVSGGHAAKIQLHADLHEEIEGYIRDNRQVALDQVLIRQTFFQLINPCHTLQDVRDALPECVVDCTPAGACEPLTGMSRLREAAWTIKDNPRAMRQYEKILPRMEVYSAARLIY
jgi:hypothetical protein